VKPEQVKFLVVHCSATPASMDIGAREIDRWHRAKGWTMIGYHFVIRRNGSVEVGRRIDQVGAHAAGFNSRSLGLCLVGGLSEDGRTAVDNFTAIQKTMLRTRLNMLKSAGYKHAEVLGHRDLPNVHKDCPSFDVRSWF
jgi:N-acetylmuramoyl-L-alanine amidase